MHDDLKCFHYFYGHFLEVEYIKETLSEKFWVSLNIFKDMLKSWPCSRDSVEEYAVEIVWS